MCRRGLTSLTLASTFWESSGPRYQLRPLFPKMSVIIALIFQTGTPSTRKEEVRTIVLSKTEATLTLGALAHDVKQPVNPEEGVLPTTKRRYLVLQIVLGDGLREK